MPWPFLYFPDGPLSSAELGAARLDGDLVEVGEAFMPADAVETAELRAGSLGRVVGARWALTHESAGWVHGAFPDPPALHCVQRCVATRSQNVLDGRLRYRDVRIPESDVQWVGGVAVSTVVRTFVDLLRDRVLDQGDSDRAVRIMLEWRPGLADDGLRWLEQAGPVHHKRAAQEYLRAAVRRT
ncbi:SAM-dependent methyltransferase [Microbacterium sp. LjRoot45]|uniref:SAM-dependent methyltransferase n=1 Tax=Microbacterium sp. LjRoot45 TaxID=3342329 RepID=UPI003ECCCBF5